jgi:hypothetical protein
MMKPGIQSLHVQTGQQRKGFYEIYNDKTQAIIFTTISFNKPASLVPESFMPMLRKLY